MPRIYLILLMMISLAACRKEIANQQPDFDISVESATIPAGGTVNFKLSGNPDIISFYSGEIGNDYDSIDGRIMPSQLFMSFSSQVLDGMQENQFSVHASTDFSGEYTVDAVKAATWTDISSRFRIATPADNRATVPSGSKDVSDLLAAGKPIYIAYHYINRPNAQFGRYNLWRFSAFQLNAVTPFNAVTLATQSTAAWSIVLDGPWETGRVAAAASNFTFRGNITNTEVYQEAWAVSRGVEASSSVDMGPDHAIPIKAVADPAKTSYQHLYDRPGTYKVTFVAANQNADYRKEVIKQIEITVTP